MTRYFDLSRYDNHPLLWPILAALLIITWSSGFIGIRFAHQDIGMANLLFWRMLLSGLILLPFALLIGPKLRWRAGLQQALFGLMAIFLYTGGCALAIAQRVPTGLVALIADLLPLMIACLSRWFLSEAMSGKQWIGTGIALSGVLLVSLESITIGSAPSWAYGLTVAAMLSMALVSVWMRKGRQEQLPLHQSICIQTLTASVLFGLCALWQGDIAPPLTMRFAFGMVWLVVIATYGAYFIYYACLKLYPAAKVSAAIYLSPPVTMILAAALFSEPLTLTMLAGLAVTFCGVLLAAK
jgi:drug/metabolite transporter (DMT)-like permease